MTRESLRSLGTSLAAKERNRVSDYVWLPIPTSAPSPVQRPKLRNATLPGASGMLAFL